MTDKDDFLGDQELERILAQLGQDAPEPTDDLMARILADAEESRVVPGARIDSVQDGLIDTIMSLLGGWKGAGGLVTAGLFGIWIGVSPPTLLETTTTDLWDIFSPDLTAGWSDYDDFL